MINQFIGYFKKVFNGRTCKITSRKRKIEITVGLFLFLLVFVSVFSFSPLILKISDQIRRNETVKTREIALIEKKANLVKELNSNGLFHKLEEANASYDKRTTEGENKALMLFREVIKELSPGLYRGLDSTLLDEAGNDFKNKHYTNALRKYKVWFDNIINDAGVELISFRK